MDYEDYAGWCAVPNTVADRIKDDSLFNTFLRNNKIRKSIKLLNRKIKKFPGIKTYSQFLNCKKKILQKIVDNETVTDESDFSESDYRKYYESFNVSCRNDSDIKTDDHLWFCWSEIEKRNDQKEGFEEVQSENDGDPCIWEPSIVISVIEDNNELNNDNPSKSTPSKRKNSKKLQQKISKFVKKKPEDEVTYSPIGSLNKSSNVLSNNVNNAVNKTDDKIKVKEAIEVKTPNSKRTVKKKTSKDVKRNLTPVLDNISSKTLEPLVDDLNEEFFSSEFQAQSTQIFSDTLTNRNQQKNRRYSNFVLPQNETITQPRDSGIDDDSREENTKPHNVENDTKDSYDRNDRHTAENKNDSKKNEIKFNKMKSEIQKDDLKGKSNKSPRENKDNFNNKDLNIIQDKKLLLKIIGEEKVMKKYKIISNKDTELDAIVEEKQDIESTLIDKKKVDDSLNDEVDSSSDTDVEYADAQNMKTLQSIKEEKETSSDDEYFDLNDAGSSEDLKSEERNLVDKQNLCANKNLESDKYTNSQSENEAEYRTSKLSKNRLRNYKSPYLSRQYNELKKLRLVEDSQSQDSEYGPQQSDQNLKLKLKNSKQNNLSISKKLKKSKKKDKTFVNNTVLNKTTENENSLIENMPIVADEIIHTDSEKNNYVLYEENIEDMSVSSKKHLEQMRKLDLYDCHESDDIDFQDTNIKSQAEVSQKQNSMVPSRTKYFQDNHEDSSNGEEDKSVNKKAQNSLKSMIVNNKSNVNKEDKEEHEANILSGMKKNLQRRKKLDLLNPKSTKNEEDDSVISNTTRPPSPYKSIKCDEQKEQNKDKKHTEITGSPSSREQSLEIDAQQDLTYIVEKYKKSNSQNLRQFDNVNYQSESEDSEEENTVIEVNSKREERKTPKTSFKSQIELEKDESSSGNEIYEAKDEKKNINIIIDNKKIESDDETSNDSERDETIKNDAASEIDIEEHKVSMPDDFKQSAAIKNIDGSSSSNNLMQKTESKTSENLKYNNIKKIREESSSGTFHDMDGIHFSSEDEVAAHECNKDQDEDVDKLSPEVAKRLEVLRRFNLCEESEEESDDESIKSPIASSQNKNNDNKMLKNNVKQNQSSDDESRDEIDRSMSPSTFQRLSQYRKMNLIYKNNTSSSEDEEVQVKKTTLLNDSVKKNETLHKPTNSSDSESKKSENKKSNLSKIDNKFKTDSPSKDKTLIKNVPLENDENTKSQSTKAPSTTNLKDCEKVCSGIDDSFKSGNNLDEKKYKNKKNIIICETQESVNSQEQNLFSSLEDLTEGIDKDQLGLNEESEIDNNKNNAEAPIPIFPIPCPKQITREKITQISQLIEKEDLVEGSYEAVVTVNDISADEEIFILDIPKTVFDKNLIGEKLAWSKTTLQLGNDNYHAFQRKVSPILSCVFNFGMSTNNSYEIVNIRPVLSIVASRKKNIDNLEKQNKSKIQEDENVIPSSIYIENESTDTKNDDQSMTKMQKKKKKVKDKRETSITSKIKCFDDLDAENESKKHDNEDIIPSSQIARNGITNTKIEDRTITKLPKKNKKMKYIDDSDKQNESKQKNEDFVLSSQTTKNEFADTKNENKSIIHIQKRNKMVRKLDDSITTKKKQFDGSHNQNESQTPENIDFIHSSETVENKPAYSKSDDKLLTRKNKTKTKIVKEKESSKIKTIQKEKPASKQVKPKKNKFDISNFISKKSKKTVVENKILKETATLKRKLSMTSNEGLTKDDKKIESDDETSNDSERDETIKNDAASEIDIEEHKVSMPDDFKQSAAIKNIDGSSSSNNLMQKTESKTSENLKKNNIKKIIEESSSGISHVMDVVHFSSENELAAQECNKDQDEDINNLSPEAAKRLEVLRRFNLCEESEEESDDESIKSPIAGSQKKNNDNKMLKNNVKQSQSSDDESSDESDRSMSPFTSQRPLQYRKMNLIHKDTIILSSQVTENESTDTKNDDQFMSKLQKKMKKVEDKHESSITSKIKCFDDLHAQNESKKQDNEDIIPSSQITGNDIANTIKIGDKTITRLLKKKNVDDSDKQNESKQENEDYVLSSQTRKNEFADIKNDDKSIIQIHKRKRKMVHKLDNLITPKKKQFDLDNQNESQTPENIDFIHSLETIENKPVYSKSDSKLLTRKNKTKTKIVKEKESSKTKMIQKEKPASKQVKPKKNKFDISNFIYKKSEKATVKNKILKETATLKRKLSMTSNEDLTKDKKFEATDYNSSQIHTLVSSSKKLKAPIKETTNKILEKESDNKTIKNESKLKMAKEISKKVKFSLKDESDHENNKKAAPKKFNLSLKIETKPNIKKSEESKANPETKPKSKRKKSKLTVKDNNDGKVDGVPEDVWLTLTPSEDESQQPQQAAKNKPKTTGKRKKSETDIGEDPNQPKQKKAKVTTARKLAKKTQKPKNSKKNAQKESAESVAKELQSFIATAMHFDQKKFNVSNSSNDSLKYSPLDIQRIGSKSKTKRYQSTSSSDEEVSKRCSFRVRTKSPEDEGKTTSFATNSGTFLSTPVEGKKRFDFNE